MILIGLNLIEKYQLFSNTEINNCIAENGTFRMIKRDYASFHGVTNIEIYPFCTYSQFSGVGTNVSDGRAFAAESAFS